MPSILPNQNELAGEEEEEKRETEIWRKDMGRCLFHARAAGSLDSQEENPRQLRFPPHPHPFPSNSLRVYIPTPCLLIVVILYML